MISTTRLWHKPQSPQPHLHLGRMDAEVGLVTWDFPWAFWVDGNFATVDVQAVWTVAINRTQRIRFSSVLELQKASMKRMCIQCLLISRIMLLFKYVQVSLQDQTYGKWKTLTTTVTTTKHRISTHQTSLTVLMPSPFNTWLALLVLFSGCKPGMCQP